MLTTSQLEVREKMVSEVVEGLPTEDKIMVFIASIREEYLKTGDAAPVFAAIRTLHFLIRR